MRRRDLLKHAASAGLAVPLAAHAASSTQATTAATAPAGHTQDDLPDGRMVRKAWVARLTRIAEPVLTHLAAGTLKRAMPVEGSADRRAVTHLEAFGHTLSGVAPWLDLPADDTAEGRTRARLTQLAGDALREATDPGSPDALNFSEGSQPLHQPGIGERYISTGSLYLAATAFLPLGLPADDPFWTGPGLAWTARRAWSRQPFPIDSALKEV